MNKPIYKRIRLAPEVNRFVFVKNLPYKITSEELYDIFTKFGPVRQIRRGTRNENKGTAFIVYDDIFEIGRAHV